MKKILSIEDEHQLQNLLIKSFEREGYTFLQAYDGERGLQVARESHPDCILLDLILPKRGGFSVLEELKKDEKTKNIPVIILTNLDKSEDVERALRLGALMYLLKTDYDPTGIIQKVKKVLETHGLKKVGI